MPRPLVHGPHWETRSQRAIRQKLSVSPLKTEFSATVWLQWGGLVIVRKINSQGRTLSTPAGLSSSSLPGHMEAGRTEVNSLWASLGQRVSFLCPPVSLRCVQSTKSFQEGWPRLKGGKVGAWAPESALACGHRQVLGAILCVVHGLTWKYAKCGRWPWERCGIRHCYKLHWFPKGFCKCSQKF